MLTFTKLYKLPSELQEHSLSYNYSKELKEYAQLSNVCNEEIQKFNKIAPKYLWVRELTNGNDGIMIFAAYKPGHAFYLYFVAASDDTHKFVRTDSDLIDLHDKFEDYTKSAISRGNVRQAAFKYLEKLFKYTATTRIEELLINCSEWPGEEMRRIPAMFKVTTLIAKLYPSMCDTFMKLMYETADVRKLDLSTGTIDQKLVILPLQFFESDFFKQLEYVDFSTKAMVSDEAFLSSTAKFLRLKCDTISETAINRKVQQWCETQNELKFEITSRNDRRWNRDVLLHNLPFETRNEDYFIRRQDGKVGVVRFREDRLEFSLE